MPQQIADPESLSCMSYKIRADRHLHDSAASQNQGISETEGLPDSCSNSPSSANLLLLVECSGEPSLGFDLPGELGAVTCVMAPWLADEPV